MDCTDTAYRDDDFVARTGEHPSRSRRQINTYGLNSDRTVRSRGHVLVRISNAATNVVHEAFFQGPTEFNGEQPLFRLIRHDDI